MSNWVSVKDAKPKPHSKVLVQKNNGLITIMEWFSIDGYAFWWWSFGGWIDQTRQISHWMYIPEPPKL